MTVVLAGERTGTFRLGGDRLLVKPDGDSPISFGSPSVINRGYATNQ